ncbi:MAG: hypothetical protein LKF53_00590 [Solobacterium sp.]|jgi:hypothetical protein|nr:hypothetical protein [Solobacterium sp.]MCH4204873.1 hypothetical protein [Solobacterium sp.]MCH4226497.1 hypothetical protein [Solobacterium sp.]MCH4283061.1 hypothetical protein [Solobacterium sp.]
MEMELGDWIFYVLDAVIFGMLIVWTVNSRKVKVATKVGARWLVPALFAAVAVVGVFRYTGVFRWTQTIALLVFAVMYYILKSGLCEEGIVMNGALTHWEDAGTVTLSKKDSCILFRLKKRNAALYFDPDQLDEVRGFLAARAVKTSADKSKIR